MQNEAAQLWQRALESEKKLFNGPLASLLDSIVQKEMLILTLEQTCFRDQMYSNHKMADWLASGHSHLATRGLGISAVVETADEQILLIRRSEKVDGHAGFLDVIGGHVHPVEHAPDGARPDVFFAIEDEIRCELGVPVEAIAETVCIGLAEDCGWCKPELVFVSKVALPKQHIIACSASAEERFEYSEILAVPANFRGVHAFLENSAMHCTPSAEGSLHLYRDYLQDLKR